LPHFAHLIVDKSGDKEKLLTAVYMYYNYQKTDSKTVKASTTFIRLSTHTAN